MSSLGAARATRVMPQPGGAQRKGIWAAARDPQLYCYPIITPYVYIYIYMYMCI